MKAVEAPPPEVAEVQHPAGVVEALKRLAMVAALRIQERRRGPVETMQYHRRMVACLLAARPHRPQLLSGREGLR